jgi:hypothetical protein
MACDRFHDHPHQPVVLAVHQGACKHLGHVGVPAGLLLVETGKCARFRSLLLVQAADGKHTVNAAVDILVSAARGAFSHR